MKILRPLFLLAALALASCNRTATQPAPPDEKEVERRVQERLAEEKRGEDVRRAREREEQLNQRESDLKAREADLQAQHQTPAEEPAPIAAAAGPERGGTGDSYQIFYDSLAPHGAWMELDNYGYVWQPRATLKNGRWRPYTDGRWAYTDQGWTWISNEPWGWAAYHYGRWARLRRLGWVWVPGDVWAPAWVSWRYSDRYVGWAPLPPTAQFNGARGIHEFADQQFDLSSDDYTFVPATAFGDDELTRVTLPPEQNAAFFPETANVTNIVEINTIIINNGPNFAIINAHVHRPIDRFKIERGGASRDGQNRAEINGQVVRFAAPRINRSAVAAKPQAAQRTTDTRAERSHNAVVPAQTSTAAEAQPNAAPQVAASSPVAERKHSARPAMTVPPQQQAISQTPAIAATPDPNSVAEQQRRAAAQAQAQADAQAKQAERQRQIEATQAAQARKVETQRAAQAAAAQEQKKVLRNQIETQTAPPTRSLPAPVQTIPQAPARKEHSVEKQLSVSRPAPPAIPSTAVPAGSPSTGTIR